MAFIAGTETFARRSAFEHAETVLAAYLQGREKAYAVHDALRELEALFHDGAKLPAALIRRALALPADDEGARLALVTEAMELIGRMVRNDAVRATDRA